MGKKFVYGYIKLYIVSHRNGFTVVEIVMNSEIKDSIKKEIIVAIIGGIIAVSALLLIFISDLYISTYIVYHENGFISKDTSQIPLNSSIVYFYLNSSSYRTMLLISSNEGIVSLSCRGRTDVYNLTAIKEKSIVLSGLASFNITYADGNISYSYFIEKVHKPFNFLVLPAFFLAMIGNVIVMVSLYRIIILRIHGE